MVVSKHKLNTYKMSTMIKDLMEKYNKKEEIKR